MLRWPLCFEPIRQFSTLAGTPYAACVEPLLLAKADPHATVTDLRSLPKARKSESRVRWPALFFACKAGDVATVKMLLDSGADQFHKASWVPSAQERRDMRNGPQSDAPSDSALCLARKHRQADKTNKKTPTVRGTADAFSKSLEHQAGQGKGPGKKARKKAERKAQKEAAEKPAPKTAAAEAAAGKVVAAEKAAAEAATTEAAAEAEVSAAKALAAEAEGETAVAEPPTRHSVIKEEEEGDELPPLSGQTPAQPAATVPASKSTLRSEAPVFVPAAAEAAKTEAESATLMLEAMALSAEEAWAAAETKAAAEAAEAAEVAAAKAAAALEVEAEAKVKALALNPFGPLGDVDDGDGGEGLRAAVRAPRHPSHPPRTFPAFPPHALALPPPPVRLPSSAPAPPTLPLSPRCQLVSTRARAVVPPLLHGRPRTRRRGRSQSRQRSRRRG